MLVTLLKQSTIAVTVVSLLCIAAWGQEKQESPWKDRAEYDLYNSIVQEQDPNKKIQLLDSYNEKYPGSKFKLQIQLMYTLTYQQLKDADKMYESAQKVLEMDPNNVQGLFFITSLTTTMGKTDAQFLSNGEQAAKKLISVLNGMEKPESMDQAAWTKQKNVMITLAHRALGMIAMNRKNNAEAEKQFREVLNLEPQNGQISYWLGSVILGQRDPSKQPEAFWHFARAANLSGDGAMPAAERAKVSDYLKGIYTKFHGDESGLDEIIAQAVKNPFPPSGFKVKSKEQIAVEKEEELRRTNPKLYMWRNVKKELTAPGGSSYFANQVKNTDMPSMTGYLISQSPAQRPDTLVLGIEGRSTPEVTLKLDQAYRYPAGRGTRITFKCIPQTFSQQPFNIGFECQQDSIQGWPPPPSRQTTR